MTTHSKKRGPRRLAAVSLAVAGALTLSACGGGGDDSGEASGSFKLAIVSDLTGPNAPAGTNVTTGIEAYVHDLNEKGGVDGKKIEILGPFDGQSTPVGTGTALRSAIAEQPDAMVGTLAQTASVKSLLESAKIPTVINSVPDNAWALGDAVKPWYFAPIAHFGVRFPPGLEEVLGGSLDGKRIAVASLDLAPIQLTYRATKNLLESKGATVDEYRTVAIDQVSFASEAAAIAGDKPDAVVLGLVGAAPKQLVQELTQAGYTGPIINWEPAASREGVESVGAPNYYVQRGTSLDGVEKVIAPAAKAAGLKISAQADPSQGWVMGAIAAAGFAGCGEACDDGDFSTSLQSTPVEAPGVLFGPITYTDRDHQGTWLVGTYHLNPDSKEVDQVGEPFSATSEDIIPYLP